MSIFKGAGVAIVTPMKSDLEVNYDKLAELLEEQIAGKTDAIIICGTTGESATMSEEEHSKVIRFAIEPPYPGDRRHRIQLYTHSDPAFPGSSQRRCRRTSSCHTVLQQSDAKRFDRTLYTDL